MKNQSLLFLAAVLILIIFAIIVTQRIRERYPVVQVTANQADRGTGWVFGGSVGWDRVAGSLNKRNRL